MTVADGTFNGITGEMMLAGITKKVSASFNGKFQGSDRHFVTGSKNRYNRFRDTTTHCHAWFIKYQKGGTFYHSLNF